MSVILKPSKHLDFTPLEPLSHIETCILSISNPNTHSITFKVKTTAPKRYTAKPNHGTIEGKGIVNVTLTRPAVEEPSTKEYKRVKFLVESNFVPIIKNASILRRMWPNTKEPQTTPEIHKQKLVVNRPLGTAEGAREAPMYDTPPTYSFHQVDPSSREQSTLRRPSQEFEGDLQNAELVLEVEETQAEIERLEAKLQHLKSRIPNRRSGVMSV